MLPAESRKLDLAGSQKVAFTAHSVDVLMVDGSSSFD